MSIEMAGLADIVRQHAAERPDTAALVHAGRTTSYAELDRAASRVANGLIAEGIGPQAFIVPIDPEQTYFPKITSRITASGSMESNPIDRMSPDLPDDWFEPARNLETIVK